MGFVLREPFSPVPGMIKERRWLRLDYAWKRGSFLPARHVTSVPSVLLPSSDGNKWLIVSDSETLYSTGVEKATRPELMKCRFCANSVREGAHV